MKSVFLQFLGVLAVALTFAFTLGYQAQAKGAGDYLAQRFKQREAAAPTQPSGEL